MKEKLVVHTCCAVCMCYPRTLLEDYDTIFYFYNPNTGCSITSIYDNDINGYERIDKRQLDKIIECRKISK